MFRDLQEHLTQSTQVHMDLMFKRLMEQQSVIQSMHHQIQALETCRKEQQQEIIRLTAAVGVATAAVTAAEARQEQIVRDAIQKVDNKYNRHVSSLQTDISQIREGLQPRSANSSSK